MPQVGNKKFPYTPSGMKRAQELKSKLMGGPTGGIRPKPKPVGGRPRPRPIPGLDGPPRRPKPGGNTWGLRPLPNKPPARPGVRPKNLKRFM